ncbi:hypothetical protein [Nonlabens antarcticus]|uniref:hypothetical protein n=1 Tax=Nonlabens antarcticus TaxID=392714 RepID=UPI001891C504|nr:hypothetical protein [Nonlabens antarcticus]
MKILFTTITTSLLLFTLSISSMDNKMAIVETDPGGVLGPCPDGTELVEYSCGGDSCVGFPRNWGEGQKEVWSIIADEIRCNPQDEVIEVGPR